MNIFRLTGIFGVPLFSVLLTPKKDVSPLFALVANQASCPRDVYLVMFSTILQKVLIRVRSRSAILNPQCSVEEIPRQC
jgi:hypothetical protein